MTKILVVGAGSIGRRHIGNLNILGYEDIDVIDVNADCLEQVKSKFKIHNVFKSLEEVSIKDYDVGFILTPPVFHAPIALELANCGMDLFIEKPLSSSLDDVDKLIEIKESKKLVIMVGYNQRFNPGLNELKSYIDKGTLGKIYYVRAEAGQYLPDWRPLNNYRKNYTAIRGMGGGILLDGSHELDYVLWLLNSKIQEVRSMYDKLSDLDIDVEDIAEILIRFENNVICSVHMDMIERGYNRSCKVVGEKGSIKWTFKDDIFEFYDGDSKERIIKKYELDPNKSYLDELKHFFECVKKRDEPISNLYTARETLELVGKIKTDGLNKNTDC
jgi:predicted dehydrogenase